MHLLEPNPIHIGIQAMKMSLNPRDSEANLDTAIGILCDQGPEGCLPQSCVVTGPQPATEVLVRIGGSDTLQSIGEVLGDENGDSRDELDMTTVHVPGPVRPALFQAYTHRLAAAFELDCHWIDLVFHDLTVLPIELLQVFQGVDDSLLPGHQGLTHHWEEALEALFIGHPRSPLRAAVYQVDGATQLMLRVRDPLAIRVLAELWSQSIYRLNAGLHRVACRLLVRLVDFGLPCGAPVRPTWWRHVVGNVPALELEDYGISVSQVDGDLSDASSISR